MEPIEGYLARQFAHEMEVKMKPEAHLKEVHPREDSWQWSGQEETGQYQRPRARGAGCAGLAGDALRGRLLTWGRTSSSLFGEEPGPGCEAFTLKIGRTARSRSFTKR